MDLNLEPKSSKLSSTIGQKNSLSCKFCLASFSNKTNCNRHEKICTKNKETLRCEFTCSKCQAFFNRKDNLSKHIKICDVSCNSDKMDLEPNSSKLSSTIEEKKNLKNKERLRCELTCSKCHAFFSRKDNLSKHIKICDVSCNSDEMDLEPKSSKLSSSIEIKNNLSCKFCLSSFSNKRNCNRHEESCTKNKERLRCNFTCSKCQASFSRKDSLKTHTKVCNVVTSVQSDVNTNSVNKSPLAPRPKKMKTPCPVKNCNMRFYHKSALINHLGSAHKDVITLYNKEVRNFLTYEEFLSWKEEEEKKTVSRFTKKMGQNNGQYIYYYCQHDGSEKLHFKKKTSRCNNKGRIKCGDFCISKMKVKKNEDGSIEVEYFPTHTHRYSSAVFIHHAIPESTSNDSCRQPEANIGFSALTEHIDVRHQQGLQIADELITEVVENTWEIISSSHQKEVYYVVRLSLMCESDHCFSKCTSLQCMNLCSHLFKCNCSDYHPLCKHIHKIHSFLTRNLPSPSISEQTDFYTLLSLEVNADSTPTPLTQPDRKREALISRIGNSLQYLTNLHTSVTKNETPISDQSLTQFDTILSNLVLVLI